MVEAQPGDTCKGARHFVAVHSGVSLSRGPRAYAYAGTYAVSK